MALRNVNGRFAQGQYVVTIGNHCLRGVGSNPYFRVSASQPIWPCCWVSVGGIFCENIASVLKSLKSAAYLMFQSEVSLVFKTSVPLVCRSEMSVVLIVVMFEHFFYSFRGHYTNGHSLCHILFYVTFYRYVSHGHLCWALRGVVCERKWCSCSVRRRN